MHCLVTGGLKGLGRKITATLLAENHKVSVISRNKPNEALTSSFEKCMIEKNMLLWCKGNVSSVEDIVSAFKYCQGKFGDVEVLVNNAGITETPDMLWNSDVNEWWSVLETNVKGAYLCCREVIPNMVKKHKGTVINVVSAAGCWPTPLGSAYSASKAALIRLTETLSRELEGKNVLCTAINPGMICTDLTIKVSACLSEKFGKHELKNALEQAANNNLAPKTAKIISRLIEGNHWYVHGAVINTAQDYEKIVIDESKPKEFKRLLRLMDECI
jgi:NAD(P)-dependent dehydrogenase (short-subunit alcohol dehydrogenase family)